MGADPDPPLAVAGVEPYATRLKAKPDDLDIRAEEINIVVDRRRDPGRVEDDRVRPKATVSIDAWR